MGIIRIIGSPSKLLRSSGGLKSRTITIGEQDGPVTSVTAVGNLLPECPIQAGGYTFNY